MLVDINLLPKKEPRNIASLLIVLTMVLLLLGGAIYFYWYITTTKQAIKQVGQEINVATEILEIEQKKLTDYHSMNEVDQLEKAIDWAKKQPVDINFMMQHFIKLLPTRGFILDIDLSHGVVQSTIQFDSSTEAAYYLNLLLETDWISDATLTERTTEQLEDMNIDENDGQKTDDILPRYVADFQIYVNTDALRARTNDANNKENTDGGDRP